MARTLTGVELAERLAASVRPRVSVAGRPVERSTLEERMAELCVPAVSLAVLDERGEVSSCAWGASADTLFQAASISKPVAAVATMALAADGVFDLDRDVNELLKSWHLPDGDGVTVRRILSHSAGLSVHGFPGYGPDDVLPPIVDVLNGVDPANTEAVRVVRPPGEAYRYSGGGFTLLQLLLEDVTGERFADRMRRVVLDPLEMGASLYEQPLPASLHALAATGHDEKGEPMPGRWSTYPELAAAGLWTTPTAITRVVAEMVRPGRVLDERSRDEMLQPQTDEHFGLGWALEGPWFQHGGSNFGYRALCFGSVTHRVGAAVMTNGEGGGTLCADLMATIAEAFGWPDYLKEKATVALDDQALDAICGTYELEAFDLELEAVIRRDGDKLLSSIPGVFEERELFAASPTRFFRTDVDAEITLHGDSLEVKAGGSTFTARRKHA